MATPPIAPPPALQHHRQKTNAGLLSSQNFLGFLNFSGAGHALKLRQNIKASDRLRFEYGYDWSLQSNSTTPWAGVQLKLDDKEESWEVDINTDWAHLITPKVDLVPFTDKFSLPISARIGKNWYMGEETPHIELGIHNPVVALSLLAISLATGQKISVKRKELGGFSAAVPITLKSGQRVSNTLQQNLEMDATLARKGWGIGLDVSQLNALLRLRQD